MQFCFNLAIKVGAVSSRKPGKGFLFKDVPKIVVLEFTDLGDLPTTCQGCVRKICMDFRCCKCWWYINIPWFAAFRHEPPGMGMLPHRLGHGTACVSTLEARCGYFDCCRSCCLLFKFLLVFSQFLKAEGWCNLLKNGSQLLKFCVIISLISLGFVSSGCIYTWRRRVGPSLRFWGSPT